MTEFRRELRLRIVATQGDLRQARIARDDYLVQVHQGELEALSRIAAEHDVVVDVGDET